MNAAKSTSLGYSRRLHVFAAPSQDAEHTYESLVRAFRYFGGVVKTVLVDNQKAARTAGRSPAGSQAHRLVPLSDANYVSQLEMMVATLKIPLERRNKRTGRTEKARIWEDHRPDRPHLAQRSG